MKSFRLEIVKAWRELRDPYRPELHYMRGPGPRTLDKMRARVDAPARGSGDAASAAGRAAAPVLPA